MKHFPILLRIGLPVAGIIALVTALSLLMGRSALFAAAEEPGEHSAEHADEELHDEADGHDADTDGHEEEGSVASGDAHGHEEESTLISLTAEQKEQIGLEIADAEEGVLYSEVSILGEITANEDDLVHLVSRSTGIAQSVFFEVGDQVEKGDVLAVIDSIELGEAKARYYEIYNEVGCCTIDLERARTIAANTSILLEDLKDHPSLEELHTREYGDMGAFRTQLLSAYAEYWVARNSLSRKQKLYEEKIASENDYWEAVSALEKTKALFLTAQDTAAYEAHLAVIELERLLRTNQFKLKMAEQQLLLLGVDPHRISSLQAYTPDKGMACTDPNCADCQENATPGASHEEADGLLSRLEIHSPLDGTIIERHITRGEMITNESEIMTIADLSTVWVDFQAPIRDVLLIETGQTVVIEDGHGGMAEGKVRMVSPTLNREGRTATVRVVLQNPDGNWRPGMFVTGWIRTQNDPLRLAIPLDAVQQIGDESVVFVPEDGEFEPVPVVLGRRDRARVEVLSGLAPGSPYVASGAFELKAMVITKSLGSHAGHGH